MANLKKNMAYQTFYQILNTCLPLITSPYLARTLGATQQGVFSYNQSIVNYFTMICLLGVTNYGTRTIAACGADKEKRSETFWNIYIFQFVVSLICCITYSVYICLICQENRIIAWILILYIFSSLMDINWLFFGVEKFEITVRRSTIVKIISVVLVLFLVKGAEDLWIYAAIMGGSAFISNFLLWWFIPQVVDVSSIKQIRWSAVKTHIKPNLVLFIPLLAMSVYHNMDKTMLGMFSTYEQTGYYYNADKVINIPIGIITGTGTVLLPRMTALFKSNKTEEFAGYFTKTVELLAVLAIAMTFGISAIANEFVPIFFGDGFEPCINLIVLLSPVLLVKTLSYSARMEYLVPCQKDKVYIYSVFAGAVVNLIVNFSLIPRFGAIGAVIGTIVAETVACIWQYRYIKKEIPILKLFGRLLIYVVFGALMFVTVRGCAGLLDGSSLSVIIEIVVGVIVFCCFCLVYWKVTNSEFLRLIRLKK